MPATVVTLRVSDRDLALMDRFVKSGEFVSRSELIRYALKKTLSEMMNDEIEARHVLAGPGEIARDHESTTIGMGKVGPSSRQKRGLNR